MITKEDFEKYEEVREGGETNMFDLKNVVILSGLEKEKIIDIMENYNDYQEKYID